jgi:hypothetical protein
MKHRNETGHHVNCPVWAEKQVKRMRLKLSPELADGDHFAIVTNPKQVVDNLVEFMEGCEVGTTATITLVEMTDAEVDALPDI